MAAQAKGVEVPAMANIIAFFLLLLMNTQLIEARIYEVGDASGWTSGLDRWWAPNTIFQHGDVLLFRYQPGQNNVAIVDVNGYKNCQFGPFDPIFWTGNDAITLSMPGLYYFISTVGNECANGVKLAVLVASQH